MQVPPLGYSPDEVRALLAPLRNDCSIAIYAAQNAFAVGAIIRVAHSFLVREILVVGDAPWYEKASMGMHHYETIVRLPDDDAFFAHVGARPLWSVEKDHATIGLYDVEAYPRDVVLVVGSERSGLPASVIERSQAVIGIPMYGVNHSFPVAVAAGMVLSDWARRRHGGGALTSRNIRP
ncbi:MAG: TrmH family RNA methyltransferase [Polyangiales bacterium]